MESGKRNVGVVECCKLHLCWHSEMIAVTTHLAMTYSDKSRRAGHKPVCLVSHGTF